jgi:hypothetical protein
LGSQSRRCLSDSLIENPRCSATVHLNSLPKSTCQSILLLYFTNQDFYCSMHLSSPFSSLVLFNTKGLP